jgi:DNA-binding MarR family transcriptional regulator
MQTEVAATSLGHALHSRMGELRRALRRRVRHDSTFHALSPSQVEVLASVRRQPGIGVGELAASLHLAPNTVSTIVGRLVDHGFLRREADPDDGRAVCLRLTATGYRRARAWRDRSAQALDDALASLTPSERANLALALPALERLVDTVSLGGAVRL